MIRADGVMDVLGRRKVLPGVRYASVLGRTRLHAVQVTDGQGAYTTLCGMWAYTPCGAFDPQDAIACHRVPAVCATNTAHGSKTEMSDLVPPGRYRHFKGGEYTVIGTARHSETEELLIVYRPEYGERRLTVRPLALWVEPVNRDSYSGPRFVKVHEE